VITLLFAVWALVTLWVVSLFANDDDDDCEGDKPSSPSTRHV